MTSEAEFGEVRAELSEPLGLIVDRALVVKREHHCDMSHKVFVCRKHLTDDVSG